MSPAAISILVTISACTWIYLKLQKYSGSNTKQSIFATAFAGAVIFFLMDSLIGLAFK